jgi:mRNA interferase MazF
VDVVKRPHPKRGEVYLVCLDPTLGAEIQKTRPCVVVSPDELNAHLKTALIAPLTSTRRGFPFRVECQFDGKRGEIVLDQVRAVDHERLLKSLGRLSRTTLDRVLSRLQEMFAP